MGHARERHVEDVGGEKCARNSAATSAGLLVRLGEERVDEMRTCACVRACAYAQLCTRVYDS